MSIGTTFTGPVISGSKIATDSSGPANTGLAVLSQHVTLTQAGTATVSGTITVPGGSTIVDILADTTTAWNSSLSDTLSVGVSSGDTSYASGVSVAAAGRVRPTFSATQLGNMLNVGANTSVVVTITPSGTAATTGATTTNVLYIQNVTTTYTY